MPTSAAHPQLAEELARGVKELAPLPETARQLVGLVNGGDASLATIARTIELDQAVAANVLRTASSAAYSGYRAPTTVHEAVARIGTVALLNLVLGDYMTRLKQSAPLYDLSEDDLWAHSAAAQLAVEVLRQEQRSAQLPSVALTAALLHDVGKLVMVRCLKATAADVTEYAKRMDVTFVEAEHALFGTDHAEIGGAIARSWSFPPEVTDAITRHHESPVAQPTPVLDAVIVANLVAKSIGVGLGAEGFNFSGGGPSAARLGLDFSRFANICLKTQDRLADLRRGGRTPR